MSDSKDYRWIPGRGPSLEAIERMRAHFPKPKEPAGEGWFIGKKRRMYTELIDAPLAEVDPKFLSMEVLFEIASGTMAFGHRDEWEDWFRFLLPGLIPRATETTFGAEVRWLLQSVITAFFSVFWHGINDEYPGFRRDVLDTLPLPLMGEELWIKYTDGVTGEKGISSLYFGLWKGDEVEFCTLWRADLPP
jgi:hypothetical protein